MQTLRDISVADVAWENQKIKVTSENRHIHQFKLQAQKEGPRGEERRVPALYLANTTEVSMH